MRNVFSALVLIAGSVCIGSGAETGHSTVADVADASLSQIEREIVPLAEAMPADKFDFAPTQGDFKGVRTFGQQLSHVAAVIHMGAAELLGEKLPDTGQDENGPASVKGKEAVVAYLKDAFAHAHKAVKTLNDQNYTEQIDMPFGKMTRGAISEFFVWHSFDHYGQAVIYARMNGIVPPASRR